MTAVMTDCFGDTVLLPDAQEAAKLFEEQADLVMPTGTPGQTIWIGTEADRKILRVDIDTAQGRAALRWLPDGTHAVELPPGPGVETYATADGELAQVSGGLARVSPETAAQAVAEFVATGKRPNCVGWEQ